MARSFIVRPIGRAQARRICEDHPHAGTLPNSSKYYMRLDIDGVPAGLAVWGWGIMPRATPRHLFGDACTEPRDYLELCRFFVYDWCPRNTASKFLAVTHRLLKKHAPWVKWLYTYAAGFQGLVGHIYKAAGYDYLGRQLCSSFFYVPSRGLLHVIALWHRYHWPIGSGKISAALWAELHRVFPTARRWAGYNFRYLYWLCGRAERERLLAAATFTIQPYPTEADLDIWLEDEHGNKESVTPAFAKTVPIVKLKSNRVRSDTGDTPAVQVGEGGSTPTRALETTE